RSGTEYTLTEIETSIGRGSDNVFVIPDISVSRRHVVVQREGDQYVVLDQRSGNGTRVNGKNVDRHVLSTGDEIAMGDTVVRFVEPGGVVVKKGRGSQANRASLDDKPEITNNKAAPAAATPASGAKKRQQLYIVIAVLLVGLLGIGQYRKAQREKAALDAAQDHDDNKAMVRKRFEEGARLLKDGRWAEARDKLKVAAELDPNDSDVQRYLERAESEAPRAQAVLNAKAALAKRDFATAKGALAGVPDDSALADAAREQQNALKAAMESAVREARIKAENGDTQGALALLEPVLQAEPGRSDALQVKEALGNGRKVAPPPKKEKPTQIEDEPAAPAAQGPVIESYLAGDIGSAIERAEAGPDSRSKKLADDLKAFDAAYRDGLAKTTSHNLPGAVKALEAADKIDRSLAQGRDSKLGREVRRAIANLHYNLGMSQMGSEDTLPSAAQHFRTASVADPSNEQVKREMAEVLAKAKEIYQRGYFEKESDPENAKKAFKLVVDSLPGQDETAQKARRWLDKLEGKTAPEE
ncbi:MAG: FHA domain-containing protein, partial [Deltaproteobacteria bacterium]|nr:FHA domain-containing protein [Deltaproteobacteria bacterium]